MRKVWLTRHVTKEHTREHNGEWSRKVKNKFALPLKTSATGETQVAYEDIDHDDLVRHGVTEKKVLDMAGYELLE